MQEEQSSSCAEYTVCDDSAIPMDNFTKRLGSKP